MNCLDHSACAKMPLTQSQISDIKDLIAETVKGIFSEEWLTAIVDKVVNQTNIKHMEEKIIEQQSAIDNLNQKCSKMEAELDRVDQRSRSKNIRLTGVVITDGTPVVDSVCALMKDKMQVNITASDIQQCYRLPTRAARSSQPETQSWRPVANSSRPPPIFVRFVHQQHRDAVITNRKSLKGSKIAITEDLTPARYKLLSTAKRQLGGRNAWTLNGNVFVNSNGNKLRIYNDSDLHGFIKV